ncbi:MULTISPECIES: serine/threonine-protein kinase [unclassified Streptomyces]|uniref:serine/threonine-protein kinase n=1 Tax=unclassified Streptomyces TaxID=2593676 RepID=UPI001F049F1C|nr:MULTISPECIES: serine/threonine-protein kinase [unclassified Streptomyces]MCH0563371.1 serine/threonine protein kinase [Streptomyces sp. MUM 2J]MCH0570226.1 serine/threonine protein kinase [Streptomyces sp. MUM 136J]
MQGLLLAGRYRLADTIGRGGMGRVWRAHDELLHRAVAIKELTAALYVSESEKAVLLARTRAEARAAARVNHSAVVTVHDVLEHDGRPWIVMELVEGHSLADAVKEQGRVEPTEAARIGLWVLRALRAAHTAGVLHRDVKPGNVLLAHDRRVLLTDFGIAQIEGDTTITRTGEVVGSVDYLAPERIRGHDPGPASDLWALGATLYTAVEGRSPFRRTSPLSTMQAVVEEEVAPPLNAGPLTPVIDALLRKDPAARPDAGATEQMLAEAAEGRTPGAAQAYVPTRHGHPRHDLGYDTGYEVRSGYGPETAAPVNPATGRTAVGSVPAGPTPAGLTPSGPSPVTGSTAVGPAAPPRPRRRLRTVAVVAAFAAVVGAGTAVVLQQWDAGRRTAGGTGATASDSGTPSPPAEGTVPDGWETVTDPVGFTLSLPKGWQRQVFSQKGNLTQIDYSPDGGEHFVRIAVDTDPDYDDPYRHQLSLDQQLHRLVDYKQLELTVVTYRDRRASLWEYTWTAQPKDTDFPGPRHAVDEAYLTDDGTEYALYMSSPADDWDTTRAQFRTVLRSWRPKPS